MSADDVVGNDDVQRSERYYDRARSEEVVCRRIHVITRMIVEDDDFGRLARGGKTIQLRDVYRRT